MIQCAWCSVLFQPTTSSQKYHDSECRKAATRHNVAEQYKKRRKKMRYRVCAGGCGTVLSVYNETGYCTVCPGSQKQLRGLMRELKGIASGKVH